MTSHPPRTQIIEVHKFRRAARKRERELQGLLDEPTLTTPPDIPGWAGGVRVERAGPFQHAVVLTEFRGH